MGPAVDSPFSWSFWSPPNFRTRCADCCLLCSINLQYVTLVVERLPMFVADPRMMATWLCAHCAMHLIRVVWHSKRHNAQWPLLCRLPSEEYFPAFDFRGLSTVEELEWATGGMDVTGGKHVEINIFSRERLEERKVMPSLPVLFHLGPLQQGILNWLALAVPVDFVKTLMDWWTLMYFDIVLHVSVFGGMRQCSIHGCVHLPFHMHCITSCVMWPDYFSVSGSGTCQVPVFPLVLDVHLLYRRKWRHCRLWKSGLSDCKWAHRPLRRPCTCRHQPLTMPRPRCSSEIGRSWRVPRYCVVHGASARARRKR